MNAVESLERKLDLLIANTEHLHVMWQRRVACLIEVYSEDDVVDEEKLAAHIAADLRALLISTVRGLRLTACVEENALSLDALLLNEMALVVTKMRCEDAAVRIVNTYIESLEA